MNNTNNSIIASYQSTNVSYQENIFNLDRLTELSRRTALGICGWVFKTYKLVYPLNSIFFMQDPVVFSGTMRFNLDPGGKSDDNHLWDVLDLSHLKILVQQLPNGLDFECGENGEYLRSVLYTNLSRLHSNTNELN